MNLVELYNKQRNTKKYKLEGANIKMFSDGKEIGELQSVSFSAATTAASNSMRNFLRQTLFSEFISGSFQLSEETKAAVMNLLSGNR